MKKNEIEEIGNKVATKKRTNPLPNEIAYTFEDEDEKKAYVAKALTEGLEYWRNEKVKSPEELIDRTESYFLRCANRGIKPTVEEYALCLGVTASTLWDWENGRSRGPAESDIVKRAKQMIALFDAKAIIDGKMNPVTYIFRAKNYYGMRDQQDVVVTPNTIESRPRAELIAEAELLPDE